MLAVIVVPGLRDLSSDIQSPFHGNLMILVIHLFLLFICGDLGSFGGQQEPTTVTHPLASPLALPTSLGQAVFWY